MTGTEAGQVQSDFQSQTAGPSKFGMIKVTNKDLNYIQMAMSSADLQLIEKGVITLRAICNVFGLDSSLFNDPANKTFNNRKEAEKALYTNAVMPISKKMSANLTNFIARNHFPAGNVRMRQDFSEVEALQQDFNQRGSTVVALKNAGIITANEARVELDFQTATDENADKLIVNSGISLLSDISQNNL